MNTFRTGIFLLVSVLVGCSSDNDQGLEEDNRLTVDMTAAILTDFQLSEVPYVDIQLNQPEIVDGVQLTPGEIMITVPATFAPLELSLASVNFDTSKFEIFPAIGSVQSFGEGNAIAYTITSLEDRNLSISYLVSITRDDAATEKAEITGFRFEKSKNTDLASDIDALRIVAYPARNSNAIFVLVPVGTNLTNLVPTIDFEGDGLQYRQGDSDFIPYPETDPSIDFTSNYDFVSFEDRNELELSVTTAVSQNRYRVIVDVEDPIEMLESSVSTATVTQGEIRVFPFKWTNRGNHPVQHGINASTYSNSIEGDTKENILNAFLATSSPLQAGFVRPGEEGNVLVTVNAAEAELADYEVKIVFAPKYDVHRAMIIDLVDDLNPIEDIFNTVELHVKTTVTGR
ncbi:hypothetical protein FGF1_25470 [Flavobacteriaceae bacterium GF1]